MNESSVFRSETEGCNGVQVVEVEIMVLLVTMMSVPNRAESAKTYFQ